MHSGSAAAARSRAPLTPSGKLGRPSPYAARPSAAPAFAAAAAPPESPDAGGLGGQPHASESPDAGGRKWWG
eukprot:15485213-Alexandrium_andersonii.AAC.1